MDKKKQTFGIVFILLLIPIVFAGDQVIQIFQKPDFRVYAEGWGDEIGEVAIASANTYYKVTNFTMGETKGFTFSNGAVIAGHSGIYRLNGAWSFSGTPNNEYHIAIALNGTIQKDCHAERVIGSGGDVGSAGVTCLITLNAGDNLTAVIENADSAGNPDIHNINFNIVRISS